MLEYTKKILQKVSFDLRLFEKELRKNMSYLMGEEVQALYQWCLATFTQARHRQVVERCFMPVQQVA